MRPAHLFHNCLPLNFWLADNDRGGLISNHNATVEETGYVFDSMGEVDKEMLAELLRRWLFHHLWVS